MYFASLRLNECYCRLLTRGASGGLQEHAVEVLRVLLDSDSLTDTTEKSNFLERFYSSYMKRLCGILETAAAMWVSPFSCIDQIM